MTELPQVTEMNGNHDMVFREKLTPMSVDDMLVIVGEYGRHQKVMNFMFCIMTLPCAYMVMISYFTIDNPHWRCVSNNSNCLLNGTFDSRDERRCDYNRTDWEYVTPRDYSIVTEFDLNCDNESFIPLTTSVLFLGWVFGSIILGFLSDNYGRKLPLFVSMTVILTLGIASAFMPNIYTFLVCRCIIGFFLPGTFPQMFMYISEVVGGKYRAFAGLIIYVFAGIALSLLGLKAYLLVKWRIMYIVCAAPYVWVLAFYNFVPESVRYLRVKGELDEAMRIFKVMGKLNKNEVPSDISIEPPPAVVKNHKATPVDLFRTPSMAFKSIIQGIAYFVGSMAFFGVYLAASEISGHIYRDYLFVTVIEIPVALVVMDFTERFGRKKTVMTSMLIGSFMCVALGFTPQTAKFEIARVIFGMIGKVSLSTNCNTIQTWTVELYPTKIRAQGMGFTQVMARLGAAGAPFIDDELAKLWSFGASFIFLGITSFVAYFLLYFLPEMKGVPTSDAEEEGGGKELETVGGFELTERKFRKGSSFINRMSELDIDE